MTKRKKTITEKVNEKIQIRESILKRHIEERLSHLKADLVKGREGIEQREKAIAEFKKKVNQIEGAVILSQELLNFWSAQRKEGK